MPRSALLSLLLLVAPAAAAAAAPPPPEWGFYFYVGGDYTDVQVPTLDDLEELERVGSTADLSLVVQRDGARGSGMRRYLVERAPGPVARRPATRPLEVHPPVDSGSPAALRDFLDFALDRFPARRRVLVLSGHSWGWKGVIQDEGAESIIGLGELGDAVRGALRSRGLPPFDLVIIDACVTGCLEVAWELRDLTRFVVSPTLEMPYRGYPWDRILADVAARPALATRELARRTVRYVRDSYAPGGPAQDGAYDPLAVIALDLGEADGLFAAVKHLGEALRAAGRSPERYSELLHFAEPEFIVDVLALARTLEAREGGRIRALARKIQRLLEPGEADPAASEVVLRRPRPFRADVAVRLDASRAPNPGPVRPSSSTAHGGRGRPALLREFLRQNPALRFEDLGGPSLTVRGRVATLRLHVSSRPGPGGHEVAFRPGMGSSTEVRYRVGREPQQVLRYPALYLGAGYADGSPMVAECHSNGSYPAFGPFVYFWPRVERDHLVSGEGDYRALRWDAYSGWSRFLFARRR